MLPQRDHGTVGAVQKAKGFDHLSPRRGEGVEGIVVHLLHFPPLQAHQSVGEERIASRHEAGVRRTSVERKPRRVSLAPAGAAIVANEVDWPERPVRVDLAHHAANALPAVRPDARRGAPTVEADRQQPPVGSDVEPHPLVHDGRSATGNAVLFPPDLRQVDHREDHSGGSQR